MQIRSLTFKENKKCSDRLQVSRPFSTQDLPIVAKLFTPSVRCPVCCHATDQDFRFCQRCGYNRQIVTPVNIDKTGIDLESIDQRLSQLMDFDRATNYEQLKQRDSLRKELETFLASLPGHIT